MTDNFYTNCPAKIDYRELTDYRLNAIINDDIKAKYGITNEEDYRQFIKDKGMSINKMPNQCWHTSNVHIYNTRQDPFTFTTEAINSSNNIKNITQQFYKKMNN